VDEAPQCDEHWLALSPGVGVSWQGNRI
jgi:hypothetical protein